MKIIFQNQDFIIIDKPAGLPVHSGVGIKEKTMVDFLIEKFPEIKNVGDEPKLRPGIVHRLDKETSGVMIVARNQKTFEYFKKKFKSRKIKKKYLALVHEKLKNKQGKIEGEMGRSKRDFRKQTLTCPVKLSNNQKETSQKEAFNRVNIRKGRYSLTFYKVVKEYKEFSLLEVFPKTGRTHQIRIHLHSIGHPVVGDKKYAFKRYKKIDFPRMFLHASEISFISPGGKKEKFSSSLPRDFDIGS